MNLIIVSDCSTLFTLNISTNRKRKSGRSSGYPDRMHDFSVTISRCYKDVYVNSFLSRTAKLYNSLPVECFPLMYDLNGFKSRVNCHHLYLESIQTKFPMYSLIFFVTFLVTPCLVIVVQLWMERNPVKIGSSNATKNTLKPSYQVKKENVHRIYFMLNLLWLLTQILAKTHFET